MLDAQKIGDTVDDDARFAGTGAGKYQAVPAALIGNDGFLHAVQTIRDGIEGIRRDGFFQFFQSS